MGTRFVSVGGKAEILDSLKVESLKKTTTEVCKGCAFRERHSLPQQEPSVLLLGPASRKSQLFCQLTVYNRQS